MKRIKIGTIVLVIMAITMIAFLGVYTQVQNRMENKVKDYEYAMDLKGSRNIKLSVSTETTTTIKDAEGNVVEDSDNLTEEEITAKGYIKEETPYNSEEVKNVENYRNCQKVIESRFKKLGVEDYIIKVDEKNGDIVIELPENDKTDSIISNISTSGKFEIIDAQTNDVLMNNSDIKQAKVLYGSGSSTKSNGTTVYLDIEFNKEGRKKLEDISGKYVKTEKSTEENTSSDENVVEEANVTENEEDNTKTEKKITMKIDDEEIMSTSFDEPIQTGKLQLSVGSSSTDTDTLQGYVEQASSMATVLDTGNMPVKYNLDENQYILSDITENEASIAIYIILGIIVVMLIALIIRYKSLGAIGTVSCIGFLSLLLLVIRYTNVVLSVEGILGIVVAFVLNYIFVNKLLAKTDKKVETYKEFFMKIIPVIILVITFSFISWTPISSFGMVMFWAIVLMIAYNALVTNSLLKIKTGKEK